MLNRELEVTLNLAFKEARTKRHEFMTVEHLLLALLDNEAAATLFIGTIQGLVMQSLLAGDVTRIRRDAPRVFDIYRRGIRSAA